MTKPPAEVPQLHDCYARVKQHLLDERTPAGHWAGELSTSALSTATAVMALQLVDRVDDENRTSPGKPGGPHAELIAGGLRWLVEHQNADGGWGDTVKSVSNISTTMLARAVFHATETTAEFASVVDEAVAYIDRVGGVPAVIARYGKDKTFSVPILTHCALAGLVEWNTIPRLPFELACLPANFYKTVRLPVVSYALPALIAIGQVRQHFGPTWNPITAVTRKLARKRSLKVLERIQPTNGGFLEATPLTSFVTMSLAGMGLAEHPVAKKGVEFIVASVRDDGSWPIDTNLATWVTTLSVNALGDDLPVDDRPAIRDWLLSQQYREVHPYTNADPGGWSWTDLPGGVPDADDTPGAVLALSTLLQTGATGFVGANGESPGATAGLPSSASPDSPSDEQFDHALHDAPGRATQRSIGETTKTLLDEPAAAPEHEDVSKDVRAAQQRAITWLLSIQNRDGGFPTFCRGWGTLPFDRSSADITAHCLRAMIAIIAGATAGLPGSVNTDAPSEEQFGHALHDVPGRATGSPTGDTAKTLLGKPAVAPDPYLAHITGAVEGRLPSVRFRVSPGGLPLFAVFKSLRDGFNFLQKQQRSDGAWLPLWFGNQHADGEINPTYGTAKVLAAYRDAGSLATEIPMRGVHWLVENQNDDGGWGGVKGCASSVEETALAVEILLSVPSAKTSAWRGVQWLCDRVTDGTWAEPTPIGFYFAKLWYFERLYPQIFLVAALRRAVMRAETETT